MSALNVFNINTSENTCVICHEKLNKYQSYKLPECHHVFHTHCIVTWFRTRPASKTGSQFSNMIPGIDCGRCPLCKNTGINHDDKFYKTDYISFKYTKTFKNFVKNRITFIKKYLNQNKITAFDNLITNEAKCINELEEIRNEFKDFKYKIKNQTTNFHETGTKLRQFRQKILNKEQALFRSQFAIGNIPIIPLIIPTPIEI